IKDSTTGRRQLGGGVVVVDDERTSADNRATEGTVAGGVSGGVGSDGNRSIAGANAEGYSRAKGRRGNRIKSQNRWVGDHATVAIEHDGSIVTQGIIIAGHRQGSVGDDHAACVITDAGKSLCAVSDLDKPHLAGIEVLSDVPAVGGVGGA